MELRWILLIVAIVLLVLIVLCIGGVCLFRNKSSTSSYQQRAEYTVTEIPGFLTREQCDEIIATAKRKGMIDSKVYKSKSSVKESLDPSVRKSQQTWLESEDGPVIRMLKEKVATLTKLPLDHQEALQVVRYEPQGKFDAHYDACVGSKEECRTMDENGGPRYATILVYLNDGYVGGTTSFPNINKTIQPEKGKAILFYDIDPKTKEIIPESLHSGDPLISGDEGKYVANIWVHLEPRR